MCFVEQKTFSVILRIFLTNAPPCGSLCILVYKNADVDNFYSKSLRSMAKFFCRFKGYYNVVSWNRKHFLWYYVFSSQMRHLCGSLCILVYKNADVDNLYYRWRVSKSLKVIIICFVKQKTFSVILRIFLTNAPPLWFPLYFYTKMLTLTIFTQNRWEYGYYNLLL